MMRLDHVIKTTRGEREVHRALEKHPWVIMRLVATEQSFVVSQFSLGDEYKADFVVLNGFSGGWEIHFVELEPPTESLFNKKGNFSRRLNQAVGQVRRWKEFERRPDKRPYLVSQLRDAVVEKDLTWADGREPIDSAGYKLTDPKSVLLMGYHVIMGRRQQLSVDLISRKARLIETDGFELMTYDRVLDEYERQRNDPAYRGTALPEY